LYNEEERGREKGGIEKFGTLEKLNIYLVPPSPLSVPVFGL
jgi:hypothetical protein